MVTEHVGTPKSGIHYHIRWSDSSIDWKPFPTKEEAAQLARRIKKPNESYVIIERGDGCDRCREFESKGTLKVKAEGH